MSTQTTIKPVSFPMGVAAPDGETAFIATPDGALEAIDLQTGIARWRHDEPLLPLLVANDLLIAQRPVGALPNELHLLILKLNSQSAKVLREAEAIVFPDWVTATRADDDFHFEVYAAGDDLIVEWRAESRYRGGAPPSPEIQQQFEHSEAGIVRLNLNDGRIVERAPAPKESEDAHAQTPSVAYLRQGEWRYEAWTAGDILAALARSESDTLELRRRKLSTGKELAPLPLANADHASAEVTPDGLYLFIRQEQAGASDETCSVISVLEGKREGQFHWEATAHSPRVIDSRVYYAALDATHTGGLIPVIRAIDPQTGNRHWEKSFSERPPSRPRALRM